MSKYGIESKDWDNAKEEMRTYLISRAKLRAMIPYSSLVKEIRTVKLEPNDYALGAMLGEISSEEDAKGRGMLSVIVVHKEGDMQPGPGFFELAKQLGRDTTDILKCWIDELKRVHAYWSNKKGN